MSSDVGFHPAAAAALARCINVVLCICVAIWVLTYLGGLGLRPTPLQDGSNDTGVIFNYHPMLMVLAFPVLMGEALLSFRQPPIASLQRYETNAHQVCSTHILVHSPTRKSMHWLLHTGAIVSMLLGVLAAYRSHSLKQPTPIPNLYSVHSYLGLTTVLMACAQYAAGFVAFLKPSLSLPKRRALMPLHQLFGRVVFVLGLCTAAVCVVCTSTHLW